MMKEMPGYRESAVRIGIGSQSYVETKESSYLVEGALLKEIPRLSAESAYLKKLQPWFGKKSHTRAKRDGDPETESRA